MENAKNVYTVSITSKFKLLWGSRGRGFKSRRSDRWNPYYIRIPLFLEDGAAYCHSQ